MKNNPLFKIIKHAMMRIHIICPANPCYLNTYGYILHILFFFKYFCLFVFQVDINYLHYLLLLFSLVTYFVLITLFLAIYKLSFMYNYLIVVSMGKIHKIYLESDGWFG